MGRLLLLPGERIEATVAPSWRTAAGAYLALPLLPALGAALWLVLRSDAWAGGSQGPAWRFWDYLYGNPLVAYLLAVLLVAAAAASLVVAVPPRTASGAAAAAAAWVAAVPAVLPWHYTHAVPVALGSLAVPALAWVEVRRRRHRLVLTNLRLVCGKRFVRHEDVRDLEVHRRWLDRALDAGWLLAHVRGEEGAAGGGRTHSAARDGEGTAPARARPVVLARVHPVGRVREVAELVIRDATATPFLREKEDLAARRALALEALQRR